MFDDEIKNAEDLIDEVSIQALTEYDECLDNLSVAYTEHLENPKDKEILSLYKEAENDLKTLLADYVPEDDSLVQEAYDIIFEEEIDV